MFHRSKEKNLLFNEDKASVQFSSVAQSCLTLCDPIDSSPPGSPHPWDCPGKNTGAGCHFLFQCMKVKSESELAQSCPTLSNPMDRSLPGSSIHGILQARVLEWGATAGLDETQAVIKIARRNINNLRYADDTTLWQKERGTKEPLDESERGEWKSWLKTQHSEN